MFRHWRGRFRNEGGVGGCPAGRVRGGVGQRRVWDQTWRLAQEATAVSVSGADEREVGRAELRPQGQEPREVPSVPCFLGELDSTLGAMGATRPVCRPTTS